MSRRKMFEKRQVNFSFKMLALRSTLVKKLSTRINRWVEKIRDVILSRKRMNLTHLKAGRSETECLDFRFLLVFEYS